MSDTIFAPATPAGRGAIAVVRVSGPQTATALRRIAGDRLPDPRRATLRRLRGADGEEVDEALVLWFPGPASYTGEDSAELHVHGGAAVTAAVVELLAGEGLRLAEPGEFTRRAFERGRMDLSQAEAIADLVAAETASQRRQALAQLGGALSARYEGWRDGLLDVLALLEAAIDFPDEEMPPHLETSATTRLGELVGDMQSAAGDARGERVRDGVRIALVGAPNAGKSSLLNALLGRDAAIVTEIAGTTRDVVEASLILGGQLVLLADTAGLRATSDVIEAEGVRRARAWAESADIRIGVVDRTRPKTAADVEGVLRVGDILALNKTDLARDDPVDRSALRSVATSASPVGVEALRAVLEAEVARITSSREFPAVTRARHRSLLLEAAGHVQRSLDDLRRGPELAAENVRLAIRSLERITGRSHPEAVLDRVFSTFCIGK